MYVAVLRDRLYATRFSIMVFLTTLSKLIRKPHSEPITLTIPELDASEGIFLILRALSELIEKPHLEHMILMILGLGPLCLKTH